ncbi:MAG: hypothetical protein KC561_20435, partial [Myxococcales bacterium]|nr:hypothetical protein [Myxococcales bacterium]
FYVAGVDGAADDRIGSWRLSPEAIFQRDALVFRYCSVVPSVWLLAGGYGPGAWRYTARSLSWILGGPAKAIPSETERQLHHFRRVAFAFATPELTVDGNDTTIDLSDLADELNGLAEPRRLLGFYSEHGVELALERYGVLPLIRELGFTQIAVSVHNGRMVRVTAVTEEAPDGPRHLLIETVADRSFRHKPFELLAIEWLLLQNPVAAIPPDRPLLPGQNHPGLGCLREIFGMFLMSCERLGLDGILFAPSHYHVAAQAKGMMQFLEPSDEARFLNIESALQGYTLAEATRIVHSGNLRDLNTAENVTWAATPMVTPASRRLKDHLSSHEYQETVRRLAATHRFEVAE